MGHNRPDYSPVSRSLTVLPLAPGGQKRARIGTLLTSYRGVKTPHFDPQDLKYTVGGGGVIAIYKQYLIRIHLTVTFNLTQGGGYKKKR